MSVETAYQVYQPKNLSCFINIYEISITSINKKTENFFLIIHSWLMMPRSTIPQSQPPPPLPPVGSALYHRTAPTAEKALTDGDLFRCIWCREAFSTMANLSNHIKEAKHGEKDKNLAVTTSVTTTAAVPPAAGQSKNESNKMHTSTPRKLVRGQDVWLGKGEEQTR